MALRGCPCGRSTKTPFFPGFCLLIVLIWQLFLSKTTLTTLSAIKPHSYRDFSRFSEEWLRAAVVGFWAVTVSSVVVTKNLMFGALARVRAPPPRPSYSVQDRSMGHINDSERLVSVHRVFSDCPCLNVACATFSWTLFKVPKSTK